jgi:hypothetical protein
VGFDKTYGINWTGDQDIRDGLADAAKTANPEAHQVIASEYVQFVAKKDVQKLPGWYNHDLRVIVMALLANPACGDHSAEELAVIYDKVNVASH